MRTTVAFGRAHQRGISLLVVMIVVLLSSLLALWAFRSSLVNEAIVGNDADYQRTFEAAQAMIQDAEMDIRGARADGSACVPDAGDDKVCRRGLAAKFIEENKDMGPLLATLDAAATKCVNGICQKRTGVQDFWSDSNAFAAMTAAGVGARYGEYTGAKLTNTDASMATNPVLRLTGAGEGAWYWIEIMSYDTSPAGLLVGRPKMDLNLNPNAVFRITAVARGTIQRTEQHTQVVLQSTFVRQKLRN